MQSKTCTKCGVEKSTDQFHKRPEAKDGLRKNCKACHNLNSDKWRENNPDKNKAIKADWYQANKDRMLEKGREWRINNKERKLETDRSWRLDNKDKLFEQAKVQRENNKESIAKRLSAWRVENKERMKNSLRDYYNSNKDKSLAAGRRWATNNPHKILIMVRRRQAAKLKATPSWADDGKIELLYAESARLTKVTGIKHHVDHIVPLRGRTVSGLHCEDNMQILTATQNFKKSNLFWPDMP